MRQTTASDQRRRVRWFVGLHLCAVSGIYTLTLVIGGGFATPPFPPDGRVMARAELAAVGASPLPMSRPARRSEDSDETLPAQTDITPPWRTDAQSGTVSFNR